MVQVGICSSAQPLNKKPVTITTITRAAIMVPQVSNDVTLSVPSFYASVCIVYPLKVLRLFLLSLNHQSSVLVRVELAVAIIVVIIIEVGGVMS